MEDVKTSGGFSSPIVEIVRSGRYIIVLLVNEGFWTPGGIPDYNEWDMVKNATYRDREYLIL